MLSSRGFKSFKLFETTNMSVIVRLGGGMEVGETESQQGTAEE
jgi:hypothetical protein